jgi:hypothetical protein
MAAADEPLLCPFTVAVDSNESAPFHFTGIQSDADKGNRTWIVPTATKPLYLMGRREVLLPGTQIVMTHGLADYSIDGSEEEIQVERKSLSDLYSTLGQRRLEFQAEMEVLDQTCEFAAVVVEADWQTILLDPPSNAQLSPKVVSRTIISWSIRYPKIHWFCCMNRRHAELVTFQLLMRYWELNLKNRQLQETVEEFANMPVPF